MNNNVYILEDRAVLYINGEDAKGFLQNLISNDIEKVTENSSCFASLLTPQGKFLYEFILSKHKTGYLIDCEKSQSEDFFNQLKLIDNNQHSFEFSSNQKKINLLNITVKNHFTRKR